MSARYEVPFVSKSAIAPGVTEVALDISKTDFHFKAGQYATITLSATTDQPTTSQFHDFSIVSSPNDHIKLKIAFRNSDSFFKKTLLSLPLGAPIILEGPSSRRVNRGVINNTTTVPSTPLWAGWVCCVRLRWQLL